jgi:hypothetical protein
MSCQSDRSGLSMETRQTGNPEINKGGESGMRLDRSVIQFFKQPG